MVDRLEAVFNAAAHDVAVEIAIEDLESGVWEQLDHGDRVEAKDGVGAARLHVDRQWTVILQHHAAVGAVQLDATTDAAPYTVRWRCAFGVREAADGEAMTVRIRVCEAVDHEDLLLAVKQLANARVELVIRGLHPDLWLFVLYASVGRLLSWFSLILWIKILILFRIHVSLAHISITYTKIKECQ